MPLEFLQFTDGRQVISWSSRNLQIVQPAPVEGCVIYR